MCFSDGIERGFTTEDGKPGPVMVAVKQNGLSALHLVPTSARSIAHSQGKNHSLIILFFISSYHSKHKC